MILFFFWLYVGTWLYYYMVMYIRLSLYGYIFTPLYDYMVMLRDYPMRMLLYYGETISLHVYIIWVCYYVALELYGYMAKCLCGYIITFLYAYILESLYNYRIIWLPYYIIALLHHMSAYGLVMIL